jgi:hypothetical protein
MSSVFSVSWCVLCGVKVLRGGWDGLPVLIDVCGYNLAERSERSGCVGRSEVFGWLRTTMEKALVNVRNITQVKPSPTFIRRNL